MQPKTRIDKLVEGHAMALSERLQAHRAQLFPPDARRQLRKFTSGEVADLLGVKDAYLRKLDLEGKGPSPETRTGGRRYYSPQDIQALRQLLEKGAKSPGTYLPGRRDGDHLQVITVINFKGGSGKTTTAAHLAQKLALDGYRVLAIDLDPQASLSALHGVQPEFDLSDGGTIYDAIRYEDPVSLRNIIQKTYFTNLDLIPGNLELMEFEHDTPRAILERSGKLFFTRIGDALAEAIKQITPSGWLTPFSATLATWWDSNRTTPSKSWDLFIPENGIVMNSESVTIRFSDDNPMVRSVSLLYDTSVFTGLELQTT